MSSLIIFVFENGSTPTSAPIFTTPTSMQVCTATNKAKRMNRSYAKRFISTSHDTSYPTHFLPIFVQLIQPQLPQLWHICVSPFLLALSVVQLGVADIALPSDKSWGGLHAIVKVTHLDIVATRLVETMLCGHEILHNKSWIGVVRDVAAPKGSHLNAACYYPQVRSVLNMYGVWTYHMWVRLITSLTLHIKEGFKRGKTCVCVLGDITLFKVIYMYAFSLLG